VTRYLVDTNVISATAPTAAVKRPEVAEWMDSHSSDLFLSAISIAEIADGRVLCGDPSFEDHWQDISGYAKLVSPSRSG
jgi:predicted nucleic acid-binding protein